MMDFIDLATQCAPEVHVTTLSSIVQHESSANPYAIGVNGNISLLRQPKNKFEAIATAEWLKVNGHDFDAGLGQINIRNLDRLGMGIPDLFDPCANLRGTAAVLTDCYKRALVRYEPGQPALRAALSCYNTGNFFTGFSNGYIAKVEKNATAQIPALMPIDEDPLSINLNVAYSQKPDDHKAKKNAISTHEFTDAFSNKKYDAFYESSIVSMNQKERFS
jgi:type IV secretion system protein VirB1